MTAEVPAESARERFAFSRILPRLGRNAVIHDAAIEVGDGRILGIARGVAPPAGGQRLAVPALINAHDHGYGMRPLDFGVADDALEPFIAGWGMRPETDPYLEAVVAFGRMALAGIGSTMHLLNSHRLDTLHDEAGSLVRAAADIGIRLTLSCPVLDRNAWLYGGPHRLGQFLSAADWHLLEGTIPRYPPARAQIDGIDELASTLVGRDVDVQYGPIGPQWCKDETLAAIAQASASNGRRVHMHFLESRRQRAWLDHNYPDGVVVFLDRIGLLTPRLTLAHCVQITRKEAELLAARGVRVVSNPASNLRYRSGVAPLAMLRASGVEVAFGMDGAALDDDQDLWRELRLARLLHGGHGLDDEFPPAELLDCAQSVGARILGGEGRFGALETGWSADFAALDLDRLEEDALYPDSPDLNLRILTRMRAELVCDLTVAGRRVVRDGTILGLDYPAARAEFLAQCRARARDSEARQLAAAMREAVRRYYATGGHLHG